MSQLEDGKALVEREVIATQTRSTVIVNDGSNEVGIPGYPYRFKAQGDKILVSVDIFKSGYECKTCKGAGILQMKCPCEITKRPGYKYEDPQVPTQIDMLCQSCKGDYISQRKDIECPDCNGKKALLNLPDTAKNLPTTGVIVSLGPLVDSKLSLQNGDRVLFGAYTGVMIPTKAPGIVFKVLRDIEVLCTIKGGEEMAAFDFVITDKDL